jgi:hypothetical protein
MDTARKEKIIAKAVEVIADLNEKLFEAEYELESQKRAVSKYRHFLAANPCKETMMDLCGAIQNLRGKQMRVDELRKRLDDAVDNRWNL